MTLAATLLLEEAASRSWGAVVVGAGPAGALAARELARRGVAVLLVDKAEFPRWKVCGCCLNARALATLDAVGLGNLAGRCGAVAVRDIQLAARRPGGVHPLVCTLPLAGGVALSREAFDAALVRAAVAAGAAFLPGTRAALGAVRDGGRTVLLHQRQRAVEVDTRLVLAADGLGGRLVASGADCQAPAEPGSRIGAGVIVDTAPAFYCAGTIFMACGTGGYVGLVRLEDGRLDIAAALDAALVRRAGGPGRAAATILDEAGLPAPDPRSFSPGLGPGEKWRGTPALTWRASRPAGPRLFVLGDAAGYIEPFTGEGMAWALASAAAVAPLAECAVRRWEASFIHEWDGLYQKTVAQRQQTCRVMARALRCPRLLRLAIGVLAHAPALAAPLIRHLNAAPRTKAACT